MKVTQPQLRKLLKRWCEILGIDPNYRIHTQVFNTYDEVSSDYHDAEAFVELDPKYFKATVSINAFNLTSVQALEAAVVHELIHVVMLPISEVVEAHYARKADAELAQTLLEQMTERLSRAFLRARK